MQFPRNLGENHPPAGLDEPGYLDIMAVPARTKGFIPRRAARAG